MFSALNSAYCLVPYKNILSGNKYKGKNRTFQITIHMELKIHLC